MYHAYAYNWQTHFVRVCVANSKIDAIYTFDLEGFCDKNLFIRKVFPFSGWLQELLTELKMLWEGVKKVFF